MDSPVGALPVDPPPEEPDPFDSIPYVNLILGVGWGWGRLLLMVLLLLVKPPLLGPVGVAGAWGAFLEVSTTSTSPPFSSPVLSNRIRSGSRCLNAGTTFVEDEDDELGVDERLLLVLLIPPPDEDGLTGLGEDS